MLMELGKKVSFYSNDFEELKPYIGKYVIYNNYQYHHICDTEEEAIDYCKKVNDIRPHDSELSSEDYMFMDEGIFSPSPEIIGFDSDGYSYLKCSDGTIIKTSCI